MSRVRLSCVTHWMSDTWLSDAVGIDGSRITMLRIPNTHMNESCHAYEWVMSHIWWISDAVRFSSQTYESRSDPESKREMQNNASSQISSVVREDVKHTRTNPQRKTVLCVGHTSFRFVNKTQKKTEVYDQRNVDWVRWICVAAVGVASCQVCVSHSARERRPLCE